MKIFRKSQAAMEFLMTYGWAILVVLVAIGALAYFGVLSPDKFLPSKCVLPAGLTCADFKIDTTDSVTVVLRNGLGADLSAVTVKTETCVAGTAGTVTNGADVTLKVGTCTPTLVSGKKFNEDVIVSYKNDDTGLTKTVTGTITGKVE